MSATGCQPATSASDPAQKCHWRSTFSAEAGAADVVADVAAAVADVVADVSAATAADVVLAAVESSSSSDEHAADDSMRTVVRAVARTDVLRARWDLFMR